MQGLTEKQNFWLEYIAAILFLVCGVAGVVAFYKWKEPIIVFLKAFYNG